MVSFGWHGFLGSHSSRGRLGIFKKCSLYKSRRQKVTQKTGGGKNGQLWVFIYPWNMSHFAVAKDPFAATKPYYAAVKGSLVR